MNLKVTQRPIPSSGEMLPVIGLGTWQTFDVATPEEKEPLKAVLKTLHKAGGTVVDSSPMYGLSERIVGELSEEVGLNAALFLATKVWTTGKESGVRQMKESLAFLKRTRLDLMQIHNLTDWETHLATLREWKEAGIIRYFGITHYTESAYPQVEKILRQHPIDFLQINYSLSSREAEEKLFPLAMDKKVAVLVNRPFEEGALFRRFKGKALPEWSKEFQCESWGQFFLKFILTHPAVTCIIPGTAKPHHMVDNLVAGTGDLPDASLRKKMIDLLN
jgi:diketogulonate reductase-like aldo/keto reductase